MKLAIFSDVHGNLQALQAVMFSFTEEGIDQFYCVGDIVGYGANPSECIHYIRSHQIPCVAGNHDWAVAGMIGIDRFNPQAQEAIRWTQKNTSDDEQLFLRNLKLTLEFDEFILVHGTLNEPETFQYIFGEADTKDTFAVLKKRLCFVGHSHAAGIFMKEGSSIHEVVGTDLVLNHDAQYVINVGSVGQPRDKNPKASYCIYDTQRNTITLKRIFYDIQEAQRRIIEAGLPLSLAARLEIGC